MKDCSPLLLELGPNDPGILVTQSVHKQQAGFSQTSQIHKIKVPLTKVTSLNCSVKLHLKMLQ